MSWQRSPQSGYPSYGAPSPPLPQHTGWSPSPVQSPMINHSMSPNLNYAPSPNSATPVLYLANLAPDCTEDDIIHALSQFGNVLRVVLLSKRNEAFVQMLSAEQAVYAVKRCSSFGGCQVRGKMASVHFSHRQELLAMSPHVRSGREPDDLPSSILLCSFSNIRNIVTADHVQNAFSEFGPLARMVFFEKRRTGPQGFVEFQFVEDAIRAQAILDGKEIYPGGSTMRVGFSKLPTLVTKPNDPNSREYVLSPGTQSMQSHSPSPYESPHMITPYSPYTSKISPMQPPAMSNPYADWSPASNHTASSPPQHHRSPLMPHAGLPPRPIQSYSSHAHMPPPQSPYAQQQQYAQSPSFGHSQYNADAAARSLEAFGFEDSPSPHLMPSIPPSHHHLSSPAPHHRSSPASGLNPLIRLPHETTPIQLDPELSALAFAGQHSVPDPIGHSLSLAPGTGSVLLASNLPDELSNDPDALFTLFGVYGDVIRVKLLHRKANTALVQFATPIQAATAVNFLNRFELLGCTIMLNVSKFSEITLPQSNSRRASPSSQNASHISLSHSHTAIAAAAANLNHKNGADNTESGPADTTKDYSDSRAHRFGFSRVASGSQFSRASTRLCSPTAVLFISNLALASGSDDEVSSTAVDLRRLCGDTCLGVRVSHVSTLPSWDNSAQWSPSSAGPTVAVFAQFSNSDAALRTLLRIHGVLFRGRALCLSFTPRDDVEFALAAPFDTSAGVVPGAMTPVAATRADIAVSSATGTSAASAFAMAAAGRTILQ